MIKKAKHTAEEVAKAIIYNYILKQKSEFVPDEILEFPTQLKLQKLLYFVQAAYLSLLNKPAFNEEIEAWQYGPVVREIYEKFKDYWRNPIEFDEEELRKNYEKFSDEEKELISFINETFWKYSASRLVDITHNHKPWKDAWDKGHNIITKKELQNYYKNLFEFDYE